MHFIELLQQSSTMSRVSGLCVAPLRREELQEYDAFDEGVFCRSRTWLFLSYVVSFGAVAGSVWVLMQVGSYRFLRSICLTSRHAS